MNSWGKAGDAAFRDKSFDIIVSFCQKKKGTRTRAKKKICLIPESALDFASKSKVTLSLIIQF